MSWCRRPAITALCNRIPSTLPLQHPFSTTAPVNKKFKPQDLYLLPGQPKARKSKVPKKVLAWRAQREGLSGPREMEPDPIAIFAEEVEIGRERRTDDVDGPFGLKPGASRAVNTRRPWRDDDRGSGEGSFGLGRRTSLLGKGTTERSFHRPAETQMAQRVRQTRESLVDLDKATSTVSPIERVPEVQALPGTVIPAWKIPTPSDYEKYDRKGKGTTNWRADDGKRREHGIWSDQTRIPDRWRADLRYARTGETSDPRPRRTPQQWTDRDRPVNDRNGFADRQSSSAYRPRNNDTSAHSFADNAHTPLAERSPGRWDPTKKLSIPTMQGLRALHQSDPKTFSHAVLSEKFGVSREAVARIIRSRFRDEQQ